MSENVKIGAAVGATGVLGAVIAYFCYNEGHTSGYKDGMAQGLLLSESKANELRTEIEKYKGIVESLNEARRKLEVGAQEAKSTVSALYHLLLEKKCISVSEYEQMMNALQRNDSASSMECIDKVAGAMDQVVCLSGGGKARGRIVDVGWVTNSRCFHRATWCLPRDRANVIRELVRKGVAMSDEYRVVAFVEISDSVKGVYECPKLQECIGLDERMICDNSEVKRQIKSVVSGLKRRFSIGELYEQVCVNSLLDGVFELDSAVFQDDVDAMGKSSVRDDMLGLPVPLDYTRGAFTSRQMDDRIRDACADLGRLVNQARKANRERQGWIFWR